MFETQSQSGFSLHQLNFVMLSGLLGLFLGLILATAGVVIALSERKEGANAELDSNLTLHITGAVRSPGVYVLKPDSRLQDLVDAAGGLSIEVDQEYLTQKLNLAQKIADGQKIYIPIRTEVYDVDITNTNGSQSGGLAMSKPTENNNINKEVSTGAGLISINQASATELESLTGIGAKRAEAIIAGRPYHAIEELLSKKIISESILKEIKPQIKL
ncbi:MAG TPA: helix-hairpin-helix domain-containing protein [Candidatus Woesebacteria bacterium]|nr:helix-hairpin-helix domain-containing protein [Candidatus Woesebacteria bacterium]